MDRRVECFGSHEGCRFVIVTTLVFESRFMFISGFTGLFEVGYKTPPAIKYLMYKTRLRNN